MLSCTVRMTHEPAAPHPTADRFKLSFGKYRGRSLGELARGTPAERSYLEWLANCKDFFDPYWPIVARATLDGQPVPFRGKAQAASVERTPAAAPKTSVDTLRKQLDCELSVPGMLVPLFGYQKVAVKFWLETGCRCILADEVGLGKTIVGAAAGMLTDGTALVVCEAAQKEGWRKKLKVYTGQDATVWYGAEVEGPLTAKFHIINYDVFLRRKDQLKLLGFRLLVLDECHRLSNRKTQRTLAVFGGQEKKTIKGTKQKLTVKHDRFDVPRCLMLTATPVNNHPSELWPLLHYIRPDRFSDFYRFGMKYGAFPKGNLRGLPSTPRNLTELHEEIQSVLLRRTEDDVNSVRPRSLPDQELWVELDQKQKKQYKALLDSLLGEWAEEGKPTLAAMHELREWLNEIKLPYVWDAMDALLEAGKPVVLFATRIDPLKETMERYGKRAVLIDGSMTGKKRQAQVDAFSEGRAEVACISIRAGGTGIDGLQHRSHHAFFLDLDWVPALHHQAKGRLDRTGQQYPVQASYAMVAGTADEYLREIIERKLAITGEIVEGKAVKLARKQSVFKEFVQRLKREYKRMDIGEADENEGSADAYLEAA